MKKHTANWLFTGVIVVLGITILCIPYNRKANTTAKPSNDTISDTSVTEFQRNPIDTMALQGEETDTVPFIEPPFATLFDSRLHPKEVIPRPYDEYDGYFSIQFSNMRLIEGDYPYLRDDNNDWTQVYYLSVTLPSRTIQVQTSITDVDDEFHNNLLLIRNKNRWGYLNTLGRIEIPCIYDHASPFENGTATVRKNVTWYQIDTTGRIVYTYRDSLPYHLESIVTKSQKLHPVKNIRKGLTKVFELYESWRTQYMTNPAFRYFYATGSTIGDNPKRYPMPPIDHAENKEQHGLIFFTPCWFNNDSIPDYFITILPDDLANGCGISHSPLALLITSDGEGYRLHNDPLRRQYKALQRWFGAEYQEPYEQQSPWVGVDNPDKQGDTFILDGICYDAYSRLGAEFTTRIIHPGTPQEWGYTTLDCKEYATQYYYFASSADSDVRHWTTTLYH